MLTVVMLFVVILSVVRLSVVMMSVMASFPAGISMPTQPTFAQICFSLNVTKIIFFSLSLFRFLEKKVCVRGAKFVVSYLVLYNNIF